MIEIKEPQHLRTRLVKTVLEQFLEDVSFEPFRIPEFLLVLQSMMKEALAFPVEVTLEDGEDIHDLNILAGTAMFEENGSPKTVTFNAAPSATVWDNPAE